tara:strand:- start:18223 stop:18717 length:495 start_codon:yes stop_codon:yes gene_type:complete
VAKQTGPFTVLGRFNSTRNPENIYVVKRHHDIAETDSKHISCNCPGWRFSPKRNNGNYTCRHIEYVEDHGKGTIENHKYLDSDIARAANSLKKFNEPKAILARACQSANVHIGNHAFRQLLAELKPYLTGPSTEAAGWEWPRPTSPTTTTNVPNDDVLRVITLD